MHEKVWWMTAAPVEYPTLSVRTPFRMLPCPSANNEPTAATRVPSTKAPSKENPYVPWMLPTVKELAPDPEAASVTSPNANTGTDSHFVIEMLLWLGRSRPLWRGPPTAPRCVRRGLTSPRPHRGRWWEVQLSGHRRWAL